MNISTEYLQLFRTIGNQISIPRVCNIYLPLPVDETEKKDQFGFVILQDGSAGAFYTSLGDSLGYLRNKYPDGETVNQQCLSLIEGFSDESIAIRAVALGAINAASQHIMRRAGYLPFSDKKIQVKSTGVNKPEAGDRIGMIGYFAPLIERLLAKNINVLVLEKIPERVELQSGLQLTEDVSDLKNCDHILCTASTLINQTLEEVLSHSHDAKSFSLIGPSSSSLPDVLFSHGVNSVGGFHFHDSPAIKQALIDQLPWGDAGTKYQLVPETYPGIEVLLKMINLKETG